MVRPGTGRTPCGRGTLTHSRTSIICGASPHWPGVTRHASGRHPPSTARWSALVRTPHDRPSPSSERWSRSVVSLRDAWLLLSGTGRVLVGKAGPRVDAHHAPGDTVRGSVSITRTARGSGEPEGAGPPTASEISRLLRPSADVRPVTFVGLSDPTRRRARGAPRCPLPPGTGRQCAYRDSRLGQGGGWTCQGVLTFVHAAWPPSGNPHVGLLRLPNGCARLPHRSPSWSWWSACWFRPIPAGAKVDAKKSRETVAWSHSARARPGHGGGLPSCR